MPASASEEDAISNTPKTVGAPDTPDAVKKPNNKHPHNWRRADVLAFLVANKNGYDIDDKHIKVIEKNEVTGRGLLQLSLKDLSDAPYNLPDGVARGIVALVNSVKRKFFLLTEIRISAPVCIIENIATLLAFFHMMLMILFQAAPQSVFIINAEMGKSKKSFSLPIDPWYATLSDLILRCYNALGPIEIGVERFELSYRGMGDGNWAQLIDDITLRYILQRSTADRERVLNIKLEMSKKEDFWDLTGPEESPFANLTDPDEVLLKLGVGGSLETIQRFFPRAIALPDNDKDFEHCIEDIKHKLRGFGDGLGLGGRHRREFVSTVLLAAVLLVPGTRLDVKKSLIGDEKQEILDYSVLNGSDILCRICHARESNLVESTAMNLMQCKEALQQNKRKGNRGDEFDYIYGISTTAEVWRYIMLTSEGEVYRTAYVHHLPLDTASIEDDQNLRKSVKEIVVTIAWMLQDRAQGDGPSAKSERVIQTKVRDDIGVTGRNIEDNKQVRKGTGVTRRKTVGKTQVKAVTTNIEDDTGARRSKRKRSNPN